MWIIQLFMLLLITFKIKYIEFKQILTRFLMYFIWKKMYTVISFFKKGLVAPSPLIGRWKKLVHTLRKLYNVFLKINFLFYVKLGKIYFSEFIKLWYVFYSHESYT